MSGWFSLGREDGNPSWYEDDMAEFFQSSEFQISALGVGIFLSFFAVLIYVVSLYRKERTLPCLKLLLCVSSGFILIPAMLVPSWGESQQGLLAQIGQNKNPFKTTVGIKSGLWKAEIYMKIPETVITERCVSLKIPLGNRKFMHHQHRLALRNGWPYPLTFITSLLGGEKHCWDSLLGQCLYKASCFAEPCFISSVCIWILWGFTFKVVPSINAYVLVMYGVSLLVTSGLYSYIVYFSCPKIILSNGEKLVMEMGWCCKLLSGFGICLSVLGLIIKFTEHVYNKKIQKSSDRNLISTKHDLEMPFDVAYSLCDDELTSKIDEETNQKEGKIPNLDNSKYFLNNEIDTEHLSPSVLSQMFVQ